jgi:uncharacterized protein (TIGR03083 family)
MTAPAPTTDQHQASTIWPLVHAERAALAEDLASLDEAQWAHPSLCEGWVIEDVVAHRTAAASISPASWLASVLGARFDFDLHNDRRLAEYRGATPAETLERFRRIVTSTMSAPGAHRRLAGWGRRACSGHPPSLELARMPPVGTVSEVARFYARRNFAVATRTAIEGLRLEATDGPFATGTGPLVSGTTLALTMAMAGRRAYCDNLSGPGVSILRARCSSG